MAGAEPNTRLVFTQHESGGLVWGYRLHTAAAVDLAGLERSDEACPVWLHFNLSDGRARTWLAERSGLPAAALKVLLDPQPRVRVQPLNDALVGIVDDLHHDFHGDPEGFGELRFFVDETRVVSARRHPLKAVDVLHRSLQQGEVFASTDVWLDHFVEGLAKSFSESVHTLVEQVDELEDHIVAGKSTEERRATLAEIRRLLVRFRRHVNADRSALSRLRGRCEHDAAQVSAMRQALDHMDGVSQDLDLVHERVRLLQEEVAGLLAEATNRNLYVLSIVTTVLLPATLVSGIWGMNVGGLPWSDDAHGFLWTSLSILGSIFFSLALLRGTRVL